MGQIIQDKKVKCYWEHVAKTLRTLGICWGVHWELDVNRWGTRS
jgi:hypothetical protein